MVIDTDVILLFRHKMLRDLVMMKLFLVIVIQLCASIVVPS